MERHSNEILNLIIKMEFHEKKSSKLRIPYVELYCYVSDLPRFIQLCVGEEKWNNQYGSRLDYEWNIQRLNRSRAIRPNFRMFINHMYIYVYPKENLIVSKEAGLHYICQHIFDFLPSEIHGKFYAIVPEEDFVIGKLYVEHGKNHQIFNVKASDILQGFGLHKEQVDSFKDTFSIWIKHREDERNANK